MTMVENYGRFKGAKFLKSEDYKTVTPESYIADNTAPAGPTIAAVRTDSDKEFNGTFHRKMDGL